MNPTGMVFDIQRSSVHDGPGIRTTVFLKGCNLRCFWCHNPESWRAGADLMFYPQKCIGCGKCFKICPLGCHALNDNVAHVIDREKCTVCGLCARKCYAGALVLTGKERTAEDAMKSVRADAAFYRNSGGGMTVSGGEPLLQPEFSMALLKAAKEEGIHTALDTAGHVEFEIFQRVMPWVDLLLFDCKCMDSETHRQVTGAGNGRVLENLHLLGQGRVPIWVRVPVVPGVNDTKQNMLALREFLADLPAVQRVELLGYHNLGAGKHGNLGGAYGHKEIKAPLKERLEELAGCFDRAGYEVNC